jgi:hypothetical protein
VWRRRRLIDELGHLDTERSPSCARAQHACRACSCVGRPRSGRRPALLIWQVLTPVGVNTARHRPQPHTVNRVRHPDSVAAWIDCSWSAAGLTAVCLRKTVGDPAILRVEWRWPWIRC